MARVEHRSGGVGPASAEDRDDRGGERKPETKASVVHALIDFVSYCHQCTDAQVIAIHRRESEAGRDTYAMVAYLECLARGAAAHQ